MWQSCESKCGHCSWCSMCRKRVGPWAKQKEVHKSIEEVVGRARGRKLKVKWDECDSVFYLAPRALQLDDMVYL